MFQQPYQWGAQQQDHYQTGSPFNPALNMGNCGTQYASQPQNTAPAPMFNRAYNVPQQPNYAQPGSNSWEPQPFYNPQPPVILQPAFNPQSFHHASFKTQPAFNPQPAFIPQPAIDLEADQDITNDPRHGQDDPSEE